MVQRLQIRPSLKASVFNYHSQGLAGSLRRGRLNFLTEVETQREGH